MRSTRVVTLVLLLASSSLALAQPDTRDHRRRPPPPPPPTAAPAAPTGPTEPPPAPQAETVNARAGFVWIGGRWDWRNGKWVWVAGHWERERAGKRWRDGRWDKRDTQWVYVDGDWVDAAAPPPVAPPVATPPVAPPVATPPVTPPPATGSWPTVAPPPPKSETVQARAGFVWVAGQWDWRDGKWDWVAGHWERERAGKKWRNTRWEQRDGRWARVDGDWVDANAPESVPPMPPPPGKRRVWKLERPVVSSYWPVKGKIGTRVVIRGKNIPASAEVVFGGQVVRGAKLTADRVVFVIPPNATSGTISLRAGGRRELSVGAFEVAAAFDPVAEQRKLEAEQRKRAEAAWAARQQQLAKDRAAREAAMKAAMAEREATRERRRAARIAELQAKFKREFLADDDTQDELTLHAQRVAELTRAREVAEVSGNGKLVVRIELAQTREDQRHQNRMVTLEANFKVRGGQP